MYLAQDIQADVRESGAIFTTLHSARLNRGYPTMTAHHQYLKIVQVYMVASRSYPI